ncbi:MAG: hypothetical protein Q4B14_06640 [Clostridia bacterium]|nr:hypothetical protein [Clostridia bacterium]
MRNEERREWIEIFIGGAFGIIAIVSAIIEYLMGDNGAIAGCIKDIAGTLVVVVILFASIQIKPRNILGILKESVENWGKENAPLIFKVKGFQQAQGTFYTQGFALLQEPKEYVKLVQNNLEENSPEWDNYAQYTSRRTGKFIDLPDYGIMISENFDITVVMSQSHFKAMDEIEKIIDEIISCVNIKYAKYAKASRIGKDLKFKVAFDKITKKDDINNFVETLDYILSIVKVIA